ncbi:hypothetical protein [Micromonospora sp. NPDC005652]|uniref:hypothetical protein n=1 Tax=Micromonospora sp. NPDC005652 TaxID=3157046 RepID=UPI0033FE23A8
MPRSDAPQDPRRYVRITEELPNNSKLAEIDDPAASWAYVVSICDSAASLSDGHINPRMVARRAGVGQHIVHALVVQGLWHLPGHDCDRCPQPRPGRAYVHDYLQHQRSADEVRDLHSKRSAAGRAGAAARWGKTPGGPMANRMASAMAEQRRGEEIPPPSPSVDDDPLDAERRGALVTQVLAARQDWTRSDVERALAHTRVRERPAALVERALLLVAQDPATERPSRLAANHPYWQQAARDVARERALSAGGPPPHAPDLNDDGDCRACPLPARHPVHRRTPPTPEGTTR